MEVAEQRNLPHDQICDYQSFSNNLNPSSQSRKISIGITVEASAKARPEARKENEIVLPATEKNVASSQGKSELSNKEIGPKATSKVKQAGVPNQDTAALFSNPTLHSEMATTKTVEFYTNQTSVLQPDAIVHKKFSSIAYGRKSGKGGRTERVEEFAYATTHDICVAGKGEGREKTGNISTGNEALRKKLWEILGTAPSQNDQISNLQPQPDYSENMKLESMGDRKGKPIKHKQNSDSIETDSESPNQSIRRPVTRSLSRRKAQTRSQPKLQHQNNNGVKLQPSSSPSFKLRHQEKNIFAFDEAEGQPGTLRRPVKTSTNMLKRKIGEKNTEIQPRRIRFSRNMISENSSQSSGREKTPPLPEKTAQQSNTKAASHSSLSLNHKDGFHHSSVKKKTDERKDFDHPPSPKTADMQKCFSCPSVPKDAELHEDFDRSLSPKNAGLKEKFGSSLFPNNNEPQDDIQSPTFAMNTPKQNYFCSPPSPNITPEGERFHSSQLGERSSLMKGFGSLRNLQASKLDSVGSSTCSGSSSDDREFKDSYIRGSIDMEGKDVEKRLSPSPMEVQDPESSEEDELIGSGARENWLSGKSCSQNPPFMLHRSKRLCSQEGTKLSELDPISPSPKGTEESNGLEEASEQTQENGLARAVVQFALVLEKFKTKMKSQTRQKSSEILASIADRIHLHLQSIESQIQTDIRKFSGLSKSNRTRLESRFQEQQKHLKLIHSKFREEINHHLQDCRSTLDEFETYETEFKGHAERQKASHRKLLLQVEEAIEIQLGDAERSIAAIHKVERKKMQGLKHVLRECLREGLLS